MIKHKVQMYYQCWLHELKDIQEPFKFLLLYQINLVLLMKTKNDVQIQNDLVGMVNNCLKETSKEYLFSSL